MNPRLLNDPNYSFKNNEKPAAIFLLKLLILLFVLKLLFYFFNHGLIGQTHSLSPGKILTLFKWSLGYDVLVLLFINTPFFILLSLFSFFKRKRLLLSIAAWLLLIINFICILLNLVDVFYFHFHLQRADADLLYVLQHPFQKAFLKNPLAAFTGTILAAGIFYLLWLFHKRLVADFKEGRHFIVSSLVMLAICMLFLVWGRKKIIPTYPLVELNSTDLQFVQNSFHSFLYSVYRQDEGMVKPFHFISPAMANKLVPVYKPGCANTMVPEKKNIVLFIMESIPEDFFDPLSKYKVAMPFLDSIVAQSVYFDNAFSYGHSSNKGITAILAGIPTLTEIPLYHSGYSAMKVTPVGTALAGAGYQSSFFIGDNYDDFGFAKCCNWLGIEHYYCKDDIPGSENMETHTMGLHDSYVLDFMGNTIKAMRQPFFAVNYNISTHYPNELPRAYREKYPRQNFSEQMKCMNYYNECLQSFFNKASTQSWFNNTIFIFCADHWMYPDTESLSADIVQSFRIPLFIYEPGKPSQQVINSPVSQLDVLHTILCIAGIPGTSISYGNNLMEMAPGENRVVFAKENSNLYQAMDSSYVLGFNPVTARPEFCYNYRTDLQRHHNLVGGANTVVDSLTLRMKAFLQTASYHYNRMGNFK